VRAVVQAVLSGAGSAAAPQRGLLKKMFS